MIYSKVRQTIKTKGLIEKGDRIVVGVSGGPDSVALINILADIQKAYGIKLFIAHLNHMLRGRHAYRDADFVKNLAKKMKIPCLIDKVDIKRVAKMRKLSVEDAAREARYAFYGRAADIFRADKIATAHTLDDQAETVLMRLLKGAGSIGLSGIPYKRNSGKHLVIRPLLNVTREEIEKYLKKNKIPSKTDRSNFETIYLRNRIRNSLIPFLKKEFNPNIKETLSLLASILSDESSYLFNLALSKLKLIRRPTKDGVELSVKEFTRQHPALQRIIIRQVIAEVRGDLKNITYKHWQGVESMLEETERKTVNLPGGIKVIKSGNKLLFTPLERRGFLTGFTRKEDRQKRPRRFGKIIKLKVPGEVFIPELSVGVKAEAVKTKPNFTKKRDKKIEYANGDILAKTLKMRTRREGDRIKPLGMKSHKKLHDIFIDEKIPYEMRDRVPIILSGSRIVWVAGLRLSDDFRIKEDTKRIIKLSLAPISRI